MIFLMIAYADMLRWRMRPGAPLLEQNYGFKVKGILLLTSAGGGSGGFLISSLTEHGAE
jgi:hypothetical protein